MNGNLETVYAIIGYNDGILDGLADFEGLPHVFFLHDEMDAPTPVYGLLPVPPELLPLLVGAKSVESWSPGPELEAFVSRIDRAGMPEVLARGEFLPMEATGDLNVPLEVRWRRM